MSPSPRFRASIHEIITDALAASEEQLAAMRSEMLLELDQLRRDASDQARQRVLEGEATAEAMLRLAERASNELRASVGEAVGAARRQVELLEEQLGAFGAASAALRTELAASRERLDAAEARLRTVLGPNGADQPSVEHDAPTVPEPAAEYEAPTMPEPATGLGARTVAEPAVEREDLPLGEADSGGGEAAPVSAPHPTFKTQRRLAFSAAETRLAATALTNAVVDKLDLVEELVASPNFSAEERSLSLMVLLREAEQLSRMAAQFGRPPLDLTERLLELRRRTTRLLHGDEPED